MILNDLETACRILLDAGASYPVQWENESEEHSSLFYSCDYIPAETENVALSYTGIQDFQAIFQININLPIDTGKTGLSDALNDIKAIFYRGANVVYGSTSGIVETVYYNSGVVNNSWFTVSVSVELRAFE